MDWITNKCSILYIIFLENGLWNSFFGLFGCDMIDLWENRDHYYQGNFIISIEISSDPNFVANVLCSAQYCLLSHPRPGVEL